MQSAYQGKCFNLPKQKGNVLCLWSGGLDSTYLLIRLLDAGYKVETLYVEIPENEPKVAREKGAIEKLLKILRNKYYYFEHHTVTIPAVPGAMLAQPLAFLYGGFLTSCQRDHFAYFASSYVLNDDALSFINDIQKTWKSFEWNYEGKLPRLIFPLMKMPKSIIWFEMKKFLADDIALLTWCEGADKEDHCGHCRPCNRMAEFIEQLPELFDVRKKENEK